MITQNGSASGLRRPRSHQVLHQSRTRTRRLWTQNKLRKGLGGGGSPPKNDTPHHGLFSYTIGETKNREITHHMFHPINQKEKKAFHDGPSNSFLWGWKKKLLYWLQRKGKAAYCCNATQPATERERRAFQTKPSPARAYKPQTTCPSLSRSPASANLVNSLPSPTIGKFHLSPLLCLPLSEALHSPQRFQTSQTFLPPPPLFFN